MVTSDDRKVTPQSGRTGPNRKVGTASTLRTEPPTIEPFAAAGPAHDESVREISGLVGEAVRAGYDVINDSLAQGRAAAERHHGGHYQLNDAAVDLSQLGKRLTKLSRELSTTWFDLLAAGMRDPNLQDALRGRHTPHRPAAPHPGTPRPRPTAPVAIAVRFEGSRAATGTATPLMPGGGTRRIVAKALTPIDPVNTRPALSRIGFGKGPEGSLVASVAIPVDQPSGTYQGVIADGETGEVLGSIIVRVAA